MRSRQGHVIEALRRRREPVLGAEGARLESQHKTKSRVSTTSSDDHAVVELVGEPGRGRLQGGSTARQRRQVLFSRSCLQGTYCAEQVSEVEWSKVQLTAEPRVHFSRQEAG
jgi:hypothetical protein